MNALANRITGVSGVVVGPPTDPRLVAVRVLDLTRELVALVAGREWARVGRLLVERRRLLERMPHDPVDGADEELIRALRAAMAESDRTVGLLLANAELRWPAVGSGGD